MRYLHRSADRICHYIRQRQLAVMHCDNRGIGPVVVVDVSMIQRTLKESETLWGGALDYYLLVLKEPFREPLLLKEAVSRVEQGMSADEFALAAYPDGGLLSGSGILLPFQEGEVTADWYGFNRASWDWPELPKA